MRLLVRFIGLMAAAIGLICVTIGFTMSPQYVIPFSNAPYRDVLLQAGYALSPVGVALLVLSFAVPGVQDNRRSAASMSCTSCSSAGPEILVAFVVLFCGSAVLVSGAAVLAYGLLLTPDSARSRRDVGLLISTLGAAALLLARWLL